MNKSVPRGRRAGKPETRAAILTAARERFLAVGYDAASLRTIATDAGVDVALVSYYFGSKRGLFGAAMALPVNPMDAARAALDGDLATLPERVLGNILRLWDNPTTGEPLRALARAAVADEHFARVVREGIRVEIIDGLAKRLGGRGSKARAVAFSTQLAGVIMARYLIGLEPIASMSQAEVLRTMTPTLRLALKP